MRPGSSAGCSVPFSGCSVPFSCAASSLSLDTLFGKKKIEMAKMVTMIEHMTYPSHQHPIQVGSPCFSVVSEKKQIMAESMNRHRTNDKGKFHH